MNENILLSNLSILWINDTIKINGKNEEFVWQPNIYHTHFKNKFLPNYYPLFGSSKILCKYNIDEISSCLGDCISNINTQNVAYNSYIGHTWATCSRMGYKFPKYLFRHTSWTTKLQLSKRDKYYWIISKYNITTTVRKASKS